jgi:hypothetical protein
MSINYKTVLDLKYNHINWSIKDPEDYKTLIWPNKNVPTKEYLDSLIENEKRAGELRVSQLRKNEYPSIEEQLDMLYWDKINGTDNWKDVITQVKNNNPKPE